MVDQSSADARRFWAERPGSPTWYEEYWWSAREPHRRWAVEAVAGLHPRTVLELGCHCGPLLQQLDAIPGVSAVGVDVNAGAVGAACGRGLSAFVGSVPEVLTRFPDRSIDVIVSSFMLAYLSPVDVVVALRECFRVVEIGLVLVEPSAGPGVPIASVADEDGYIEWRHDYLDVLVEAGADCPAMIDLTRTARGPHLGINAVIEARLTWPN